ncbi:hypothetical protein P692DRAFT_201797659, partial [Suillus brevipes Sb2]
AFIQIMIFKAVTGLLALIPQLTPGLFSFNLFRSPITFPCCGSALRMLDSSKFVDIIPTSVCERYPGLETSTEMNLLRVGVFGRAST